jgi:hypothetical protein
MEPTRRLLNAPYDIASVDEHQIAEDAPLYQELVESLYAVAHAPGTQRQNNFFDQPVLAVTLDELRQVYESSNEDRALLALSKRRQLRNWEQEEKYIVPSDNPDQVAWTVPQHFIDLMICVAGEIGVSLLIPPLMIRGFHFTFKFNPSHRYRSFSTKFAKLGFNPTASMLFIGRNFADEDVFLAWAPSDSLRTDCQDVSPETCTGSTTLASEHYFLTLIFLTSMFVKISGTRDVFMNEDYPKLTLEGVNAATNLL